MAINYIMLSAFIGGLFAITIALHIYEQKLEKQRNESLEYEMKGKRHENK